MEGNGSIRQRFPWSGWQLCSCVLEEPQAGLVWGVCSCHPGLLAWGCGDPHSTTARRGQSCPPASLFTALVVLLGRLTGSPERLSFPQGTVEVAAVPRLTLVVSLLTEHQGFPIAFSFFWSCSSSCCPGPVEADLQSHLSHLLFQSMLP